MHTSEVKARTKIQNQTTAKLIQLFELTEKMLHEIQQAVIDGDAQVRSDIRRLGGLKGSPWPIQVVPGTSAPAVVGESYYWTTPSGKTIVHHPNAYGWPTQYHPSTRRIEVGSVWVQSMAIHRGLGAS